MRSRKMTLLFSLVAALSNSVVANEGTGKSASEGSHHTVPLTDISGNWRITWLGKVGRLNPAGIAYPVQLGYLADGRLTLSFSGTNGESFAYRMDGAKLSFDCTRPHDTCMKTLLGGPIYVGEGEEICPDSPPYCPTRLRTDNDLLDHLFDTASLWRYDGKVLTFDSETDGTEVQLERVPTQ